MFAANNPINLYQEADKIYRLLYPGEIYIPANSLKKDDVIVARNLTVLNSPQPTISSTAQTIKIFFKSFSFRKRVKALITEDYKEFMMGDDRQKEDIILKYEFNVRDSKDNFDDKTKIIPFYLRWTYFNLKAVYEEVSEFEKKIKNEFYGNKNKPLSQEYLKDLASKYSHLPEVILNDLASDKNP